MNERKTASILQRVPVILAVTAASYGLQFPPGPARPGDAGRTHAKHAKAVPVHAAGAAAQLRKA